MRLFASELKKIWHPAVSAAVLVLGVMYFALMPSFYVTYFPNGPNQQAVFDFATGWAERFGPTMEPAERATLDAQLADEQAEFDVLIVGVPAAQAAGIVDYASYAAFSEALDEARSDPEAYAGPNGMSYDEAREFMSSLFYETNLFDIQELAGFMESYDINAGVAADVERYGTAPLDSVYGLPQGSGDEEHARAASLVTGERGYLPRFVTEATASYAADLALWEVLGIAVLLAPTFVRDRVCRTRQLQWASRRGRATEDVQLAAGMTSALLLTAANLAVYGALFLSQGLATFWDFPLYSWSWGGFTWFDMTYGQYVAALGGLVALLGLGAAAWMLLLSRASGGYVSVLLKAVPLFVALGVLLGSWCLGGAFYMRVASYAFPVLVPPAAEVTLLAGVLAVGAAAWALMLLHDRRCDLA